MFYYYRFRTPIEVCEDFCNACYYINTGAWNCGLDGVGRNGTSELAVKWRKKQWNIRNQRSGGS
jgi:hypothetical protein